MAASFRVIVCDLDDTLYPEREYARSGLCAAAEAAQARHGIGGLKEIFLSLFDAGVRGRIFQDALLRAGLCEPEPALLQELLQSYRNHRPSIRLFDDVQQVLPSLHRIGRLAMLTDGYLPPQRLKVEALGLGELFDPIVYTEELGREFWKPSPRGFLAIEQSCGVDARECVYIADNPRKDFVAPRQLGWRTIRVRRSGTEHGAMDAAAELAADIEVPGFREVLGVISGKIEQLRARSGK